MSYYLEQMERMASQKSISDHDHIQKIMNKMLSIPFVYLKKDTVNYERLRDKLVEEVDFASGDVDNLSFADILLMIGYQPGIEDFDTSKFVKKNYGKKLNSASSCRFIAGIITNMAERGDILFNLFLNIEMPEFISFLTNKINNDYKNNRISEGSKLRICKQIEEFSDLSNQYLESSDQEQETVKIGDLLNEAVSESLVPWLCSCIELNQYANRMAYTYDIINRLFMDAIRIPLVNGDRSRFCELYKTYSMYPYEKIKNIRFEACYEP